MKRLDKKIQKAILAIYSPTYWQGNKFVVRYRRGRRCGARRNGADMEKPTPADRCGKPGGIRNKYIVCTAEPTHTPQH